MHYARAPIAEVVIDVRGVTDAFDIAILTELASELEAVFPVQKPIQVVQVTIDTAAASPEEGTRRALSQAGYRLENTDGTRVLQIQEKSFIYSHLAPYSSWATFKEETAPLLRKYISRLNIGTISRCAVRVVNKVSFPFSKIDIEDYFSIFPHSPEELGPLGAFHMKLRFACDSAENSSVVVTFAGDNQWSKGDLTAILDIDIFSNEEFPYDEYKLWTKLNNFSLEKNRTFEACITDKLRALIS